MCDTCAWVYLDLLTSHFNLLQVFAGFLININSLGGWISWLQYFSIFRYSLHVRMYTMYRIISIICFNIGSGC